MSDSAWCYLGLITGLAVLVLIAIAVISAPKSALIKDAADLLDHWRNTRNAGEKLLLLWVLRLQLIRGGIFALLAAIIGSAISLALSLCGSNPESMRIGQQMLDSVLDLLRDLLRLPPRRLSTERLISQ